MGKSSVKTDNSQMALANCCHFQLHYVSPGEAIYLHIV